MDKILIFAVSRQQLLQRREIECSLVFIIFAVLLRTIVSVAGTLEVTGAVLSSCHISRQTVEPLLSYGDLTAFNMTFASATLGF